MTRSEVRVRPAEVGDLPWIADLVKESFAPEVQPFLVAAQHGITAWWELVLSQPASFGDPALLVAEDPAGERLGYADLKPADATTGFLSYVAVAPAARGLGVATTLLRAWLAERPRVEAMELDVFADNAAARRLYARLGFEEQGSTTWWTAPLGAPPAVEGRATVEALPAATARHRVHGFTDLTVTVDGQAHRIGVMGDEVVRVFSAADLTDLAWLPTVRALFPGVSRALAILPTDLRPPEGAGAAPLLDSLRMRSTSIRNHLEHP